MNNIKNQNKRILIKIKYYKTRLIFIRIGGWASFPVKYKFGEAQTGDGGG